MPQTFLAQHRDMVELARAILATARELNSVTARTLANLRLQLSRAVQAHVTGEVDLIGRYHPGQREPEVATLIQRYHDELLVWRQQLIACNVAWPLQRIAVEPRGFEGAFAPIVRALEERVRWEERVFYPAVLRSTELEGRR